jgi:hypothetical protein
VFCRWWRAARFRSEIDVALFANRVLGAVSIGIIVRVVEDGIDGLIPFEIDDAHVLTLANFKDKGSPASTTKLCSAASGSRGLGLRFVAHVFLAKITKSITRSKQSHGYSQDTAYGSDRRAWVWARG